MKAKQNVVLWSGIVIELGAVVMLVRAVTIGGSPVLGIVFLAVGLFFILLGLRQAA